jgi:hypothetical protein
MEEIKLIVSRSATLDIYNMDEAGLFFRIEPNKTLVIFHLFGRKKQKERVILAFTSNANGRVQFPLLVINKYKKPKAYTRRSKVNSRNLGIMWESNPKAWMTTIVFENIILNFEGRIAGTGEDKIFLLVDNFSIG